MIVEDKKGVSEIISYVLLIGFAIGLGILVSTWMKDQAEKTSKTLLEDKAREVTCTDVALNAYFLSPTCDHVNITNKGHYTIKKVAVRSIFGTETKDVNILPMQSQDLYISTTTDVEIIPQIMPEKELLLCGNRKITVTC